MLKFTIRETILATAMIAVLIAWALDHPRLETQVAVSAAANRIWQFRAEHLRGQFNGTKLGGKWLMPYRLEFDPDSEQITTAQRTSGGEWVATPGTMIEWRPDWAELR